MKTTSALPVEPRHLPMVPNLDARASRPSLARAVSRRRARHLWTQTGRKLLQLSVLAFVVYGAFGVLFRNYKVAYNNARLVGLVEGEGWAEAYRWNERLLRLWGDDTLAASLDFYGMPWAANVFGVPMVDPVMFLSAVVENGMPGGALVCAALVPVAVAILLGKFFCSHLCPMRLMFELGQLVRGGLLRLGFALPHHRSDVRLGGWVLLGGLIGAFLTSGAVWIWLLPYVGISAGLFLLITSGTTASLFLVPAALISTDALLAPGGFCHNVCPTGYLLEKLGRFSIWKLNTADAPACPSNCRACEQTCPQALYPADGTGMDACDQCGTCAAVCPKQKLSRRFSMPSLGRFSKRLPILLSMVFALALAFTPATAGAHHNKGLPHYGYYENYPQVPTEESVVIQGKWEMGATIFNFQGYDSRQNSDTPKDIKIFVYLYNLIDDAGYRGPVTFEVRLDGALVSTFVRKEVDEESVYSTRETLPKSGEYELVAQVPGEKPVTLPFTIDLGDSTMNPLLLGAFGLPIVILFLLAGLGRARKGRAQRMKAHAGRAAAVLVLGVTVSPHARAQHAPATDSGTAVLLASVPMKKRAPERRTFASDAERAVGAEGTAGTAADANVPPCHAEPGPSGGANPTDHAGMDHAGMDHAGMDHSMHGGDHAGMDHSMHGGDHAGMDHSMRGGDHAGMDHSMHGGDHAGHEMVTNDRGESIMVMGGVPAWMFLFAVGLVILGSFVITEKFGVKTPPEPWRYNLIKNRKIFNLFRSRWFQAVPQLLAVIVFAFIVYAGLFGSRYDNIAPVAVWTLWWGGLVFAVALLGPIFCFTCPWDGLANLFTRLRIAARVPTLTLGLEVPTWLRNMWPAIGLFVLLTWAELGLGMTSDPRGTAIMGLAMTAGAVTVALTFRKKAFCHYFCPVGRIQGMYANFSPIELRARNPRTCQKCTTEDCMHGNKDGYACPTGISLKVVQDASYCIGCTECIKSCDKYNVALNFRPFASDLTTAKIPRPDEAWMCLMLLALTLFHGFSMTTVWENYRPGEWSLLKWMASGLDTPHWVNFTLGMAVITAFPIIVYWLCCKVAAWWIQDERASTRVLFRSYSLSLLPVALFYHLSHNVMHLFMEGGHIVPLLSDPLGTGANYFGTANAQVGALFSDTVTWYVQLALIIIGHVFGVVVAYRISRRLFPETQGVGHAVESLKRNFATRSLVPVTFAMIFLSVIALWLMVPDMNMRVGRM